MKNQFITNDAGKKLAVDLSIKDYEKMLEELDEHACIKAYDKVKKGKQKFISADEMFKSIEAKRKHL